VSPVVVTLAEQINEEIRLVESSLRTAVEHAWNAGRLLAEQKAQTPHGQWLAWLEENVNLSPRRAQEWMDLAASYARAPAHLSIEDALKEARADRRPARVTAADAGALLQGLAGAGDGEITAGRSHERPLPQRGGDGRDRLRVEWTAQQNRKDERARELLAEAETKRAAAHTDGLAAFAVAEVYREAAITARQAAAVLDELAFSFER
jgi:hypothetical protein